MVRVLQLSPNSRYRNTPLFSTVIDPKNPSCGSRDFFGTFVPPEIILGDDDTFITIRETDNGRLDLLSYRYYGTPEFWWVIAQVNDITDPIFGVEPGTVIRIPRRERVFAALSEEEF